MQDQDPGVYSEEMKLSTRRVYSTRYRLLPYLYTLFYRAHTRGSTVVRPLFHEYVHALLPRLHQGQHRRQTALPRVRSPNLSAALRLMVLLIVAKQILTTVWYMYTMC